MSKKGGESFGDKITTGKKGGGFSFDPTGLERAAKAARDLDNSRNSQEALELVMKQEEAKRAEANVQTKQLEIQKVKEEGEQKRQLAEVQLENSKKKAEYSDYLERKRQAEMLEHQEMMAEKARQRDEESLQRQEGMRRETIQYEQKLRNDSQMAKIQQKIRAKAEYERNNMDIIKEKVEIEEAQRRKTYKEALGMGLSIIGEGFRGFISNWREITRLAAASSLLFFGFYMARSSVGLATGLVQSKFGRPLLVRETSRKTFRYYYKYPFQMVNRMLTKKPSEKDILDGMIFHDQLERRLRSISYGIINKKKHFAPFRNLMFYGPPGTGKTLFAKSLALKSGLDYAVITGGDVAPLGKDAVTELHKLFDWSKTSTKGLLLFIDEADAFLRKRQETEAMSENLRNAINAFLYRTGTETHKFLVIMATNAPEQLDKAIHDRVDEMIYFDRPDAAERKNMLYHYLLEYCTPTTSFKGRMKIYLKNPILFFYGKKEIRMGDIGDEKITDVSEKIEGFSGREISKLVLAWHDAAFSEPEPILTEEIMDGVLTHFLEQHRKKDKWNKDQDEVYKV